MLNAYLEHVNITVTDPDKTAQLLIDLFGWTMRWKGTSIHNGTSIHVGPKDNYIVLYSKGDTTRAEDSYSRVGGLNHIGVVVDDLDAVKKRVIAAGYTPTKQSDYEPGSRFYFYDADDIEIEVVSYA